MIQPQELRIGNYIFYKNEIFEVDAISKSHTYLLKGKNIVKTTPECLNPIPLTEKILLKFGFEKQHNEDDFDYWFKKGFCDDILWEHSEGFCHSLNYGGDIKYVHQLQNLYFALTGEELTFKK